VQKDRRECPNCILSSTVATTVVKRDGAEGIADYEEKS
jgi:hypothetical protein